MQEGNHTKIENELTQIADMLVLNGTLTECPGLINGKMGISIFFFYYSRHTSNELFADYAMDLLGEIFNQIHLNSPSDFEKGIAGIGVGINHLIKNGFIKQEDNIFEDLDQRMERAIKYDPWENFSQYNGLTGYGQYWITRLNDKEALEKPLDCLIQIINLIEENLKEIPLTEQMEVFCFLQDLQKTKINNRLASILKQCQNKWNFQLLDITTSFCRLGNSTVGKMIRTYKYNH